jgi:Na+-driven multidrug efflux pump
MGIVLKVVNIAVLVIVGLAFGGQPLFGYCYGAGNKERLKKFIRFGLAVTGGTGLFMLIILSILSRPIISRFLTDPEMINTGIVMLRFQLLGIAFMGMSLTIICTFQAMGKALSALILSACRQGIVYLPCIVILSFALGLQGVIMAQFVADTLTLAIAYGLYRNLKIK